MSDVRPAAGPEAGRWLLAAGADWWDLVRFGPPGFDAYVRVAFVEDAEGRDRSLGTTLATLAVCTSTPATAYAAVWEGWGGAPVPPAPRIPIPNREMLLFTGRVDVLADAPALAWYGSARGIYQPPHLVWPEDRAWCLACEVDEEVEFTVGGHDGVAEALARALPGAVRSVRYGEPAPLYRDRDG